MKFITFCFITSDFKFYLFFFVFLSLQSSPINFPPLHMFMGQYYNVFNQKNFFRPICSVTFCKNVFIFWYSYMMNNFSLGSSSLFSTPKSKYVFDVTSIGFILIVLLYVILYSLTISSNLSIYTFFDIEFKYL